MDNKRFWDRCSKYYPAFIRHSEKTYLQIRKTIRPFLKRDMDVLELACGTGQLSVPLSPYVRTWEATDFSPEMVKQAKKTASYIASAFLGPGCHKTALWTREL